MSELKFPAVNYPTGIFEQSSADQSQDTAETIEFLQLKKGYLARSKIYERRLPDGQTTALRIDGPPKGGAHMVWKSDAGIRIITGPLNADNAGSAVFGVKAGGGTVQKYQSGSYYEYNEGGEQHDGIALSVKAYGDVVEQAEGSTRYIKATKILIQATDRLEIVGNEVAIKAVGELTMEAAQHTTVSVNKKDIITGQAMTFGAGEETTMQFDPRSTQNLITPGNFNVRALGDLRMQAGGCGSFFAAGGPGGLIVNRASGMAISTKTKLAIGGTAESKLVSTGKVILDSVAGVDIGSDANVDITSTANTSIVSGGLTEIDSSGAVDILGTAVTIDGSASVTIKGAMIYLNQFYLYFL